jgi:hypothetical protein
LISAITVVDLFIFLYQLFGISNYLQENGELCVEVEELRKGDHPYFEDLFNEEENR